MTDPIADLITRIRNAEMANHKSLKAPSSRVKCDILNVMQKYGYIDAYKKEKDEKGFEILNIDLSTKYSNRKINYKRVSRPGQRIYIKNQDIKPIKSGLGISIISTPQGIISNVEAKKLKVGGEILCEIW